MNQAASISILARWHHSERRPICPPRKKLPGLVVKTMEIGVFPLVTFVTTDGMFLEALVPPGVFLEVGDVSLYDTKHFHDMNVCRVEAVETIRWGVQVVLLNEPEMVGNRQFDWVLELGELGSDGMTNVYFQSPRNFTSMTTAVLALKNFGKSSASDLLRLKVMTNQQLDEFEAKWLALMDITPRTVRSAGHLSVEDVKKGRSQQVQKTPSECFAEELYTYCKLKVSPVKELTAKERKQLRRRKPSVDVVKRELSANPALYCDMPAKGLARTINKLFGLDVKPRQIEKIRQRLGLSRPNAYDHSVIKVEHI